MRSSSQSVSPSARWSGCSATGARVASLDARPDGPAGGSLRVVTRGYVPLLLLLAAIWGASYLFIKVALDDLEPTVMMALRLLIAAPPLIALLAWREGAREALAQVRGVWREGLVVGVVGSALPFTMIAWGEKHVDSGIAAIANASMPIFVALLAIRFRPSERVTGRRLLGVLIGLAGVGVLSGVQPEGGWWAVAGTLAVAAAGLSYAANSLFGQHVVGYVSGPVIATAGVLYGGLALVPFALAQLPDHFPSWEAVGSVLALSLAGTALAQLLMYRILRLHGASRMALVTYLIPLTALLYGSLILDERITAPAIAGLVLILGGVALGSGLLRPARRAAVEAAP